MYQSQKVRVGGDIKMVGKFIKVKCRDCGNEQIIFNKPSIGVMCLVCGATLAKPVGKTAKIRGEILSVLE
jgi:small subunit ribosomal protein S27e